MAFVHQASEEAAKAFLPPDVPRFRDPELYDQLQLGRMKLLDMLHPRMIARAFQARRFGVGKPGTAPMRLHGVVLVHQGKILKLWRAQLAGERPDYLALAKP